jgi:hypothetical protein
LNSFSPLSRDRDHPEGGTSAINVLEAAAKLGIRKAIIASIETVYGVCFADGDRDINSFPVDEDHDVDPMDSAPRTSLMRSGGGWESLLLRGRAWPRIQLTPRS